MQWSIDLERARWALRAGLDGCPDKFIESWVYVYRKDGVIDYRLSVSKPGLCWHMLHALDTLLTTELYRLLGDTPASKQEAHFNSVEWEANR